MYKNGEGALDRILELVTKCPKDLQEKCFELLLSGYVQLEVGSAKSPVPASQSQLDQQKKQQDPLPELHIPDAVLPRFKNTAKRLGVAIEKLESIFDFSVDPFALHAISLPGKNNAEKARHVALLAAARSYLAAGSWSGDWQEVKSLCVDHNCYDARNHAVNLKKGASTLFKSVEPGKAIELSSGGIQEAEKLLKKLAEASE
ncbi:MAG: hypothetical protein R3B11_14780 [Nitrospira sp.]|nr:hypothetical protein [Nitrospira sp.]